MILGGHHDLAPLPHSSYRRIASEQGTYLLEDLWDAFGEPGQGDRHRPARVRDDPGRDRAAPAGGGQGRRRGRRAARPHRPHRLRRRAALHRPAPGDLRDRPGAQAVRGRRRREPAPPLLDRAALGGDPQRPRRDDRPRPRRERRLPLRDARGDLRRRLRERRRQSLRGSAQGHREGDLHDRHPRGSRLRPPVLLDRDQARARRDLPHRGLRRLAEGRHRLRAARRRHRRPPEDPRRGRGVEAGEDLPLLSQGLQGGDRRGERLRDLRRVLAEGARAGGAEPDLDAPHHGLAEGIGPRAGRPLAGGRLGRPPRLPGRDQLDELRLPVRAGLPRLRRGRQGDQHPLHQRGGWGDPGHVRQVPQVARAAGRLGPLRRLGRDAQLLLRRRDQDRPGREARRGRAPARQEGLREGRIGPECHSRHRPDLALEQPRPLLDRGPRGADRRAQDRQPRPARLGQGPGRPQHRHDRPRHRQGGRRHHHPVAASRAAPARRASTRSGTSACPRTSAPARCTAR